MTKIFTCENKMNSTGKLMCLNFKFYILVQYVNKYSKRPIF